VRANRKSHDFDNVDDIAATTCFLSSCKGRCVMSDKKMNRREFLKVVIASAAAAGLSHFRFLNFGGAMPVSAMDDCAPAMGIPDVCAPPDNADTCPEPVVSEPGEDVCLPMGPDPADACFYVLPAGTELDYCNPVQDQTDVCDTHTTPNTDSCDPVTGANDHCEWNGVEYETDLCDATTTDVCHPGEGSLNPDVCPDGGLGDGDICMPEIGETDVCSATGGGADICIPDAGPDICDPSAGNPDQPNPVRVSRLRATSSSPALGVVAALGVAALLRPRKS
jgi:hypothetical protein